MKTLTALTPALCALLACACASTDGELRQGQEPQSSIFTHPPAQQASPPVLYARDGTVVVAEGAAAEPLDAQRREVGPGDGGRMVLLELYQNVIEERDTLSLEVAALRAELDKQGTQRVAAQRDVEALTARVQELEAERARLESEGLELAGRLTTAQIRRLQAEKLLLEHKIAEQRARAAARAEEEQP